MPRKKKPTTLKEVRSTVNLSQAGLAKALGVSTASVSAYETGRVKIPEKIAEKIKELYDISLPGNPEKKRKKADAVNEKKPAARKKTSPKTEIILQSPAGGSVSIEGILEKTGAVDHIYIRVDENKAYWVRGEETGSIELW